MTCSNTEATVSPLLSHLSVKKMLKAINMQFGEDRDKTRLVSLRQVLLSSFNYLNVTFVQLSYSTCQRLEKIGPANSLVYFVLLFNLVEKIISTQARMLSCNITHYARLESLRKITVY